MSRTVTVIGLTGGIASGKTTVVRYFARLGACIVESDAVSREVVVTGSRAWKRIVRHFGPGILAADRTIDRRRLAGIVFSSQRQRRVLEAITHPEILRGIKRRIRQCRARDASVIVVDVPLLFEAGLQELFDRIVVVWVPARVQLRRLRQRDRLSAAEMRCRRAAQMPLSEKRRRADFVIDNSGARGGARKQVQRILEVIRGHGT